MSGKHHINTSIAGTALLLEGITISSHHKPHGSSSILLNYFHHSSLFIWICGLLCLIIGALLPDIDLRDSMISKLVHFHIPIRHRTWTHTLWLLLIPIIIGWVLLLRSSNCNASFLWFSLALGIFWHLVMDSLSVGGVCWLYPITQYINYPDGAHIKKHHWLKLYSVKKKSKAERFIVFVIDVLALIGLILTLA